MIDQRGLAFTPQQMSGYKGYSRGVLVGNWQEDLNVLEEKIRLNVENRSRTSTVPPHSAKVTPSPVHNDGKLRYGSRVQIQCTDGDWLLSIFPNKPKTNIPQNHVFVSGAQAQHGVGPIGRNVWTIRKAAKDVSAASSSSASASVSSTIVRGGTNTGTDVVKYGDKVLIANEWGSADGHLVLCSEQKSLLNTAGDGAGSSKKKAAQEVTACYGETSLGNFTIEPAGVAAGLSIARFEGQPVAADAQIVLRHTLTGTPLGIDSGAKIRGMAGDVECPAACFFDKDAGVRTKSVTNPANMFTLILSPSGTPDTLPTHLPSAEQVFHDLLRRLQERAGGNSFDALRGLARTFRIVDKSRDQKLSRCELKIALTKFMGPNQFNNREVDMIFAGMDRNKDGKISTTEFYRFLRGDMNPRREKMVMQAFRILAPEQSYVPFAEMKKRYGEALPRHPSVLSGEKTEDEVMRDFIATWDRNRDDVITVDEFLDYYNDLSCSVDEDDYFELMIRNAWHISGGEGWCENTANKRVLVTHSDDTQEVVECKNDLGLDFKNRQELIAFLTKQGVRDIKAVELHGGM